MPSLEYIQQPVTENMQNDENRRGLNYKHQSTIQNMQHPSLIYDQQSIQNMQIDEYRPNDPVVSTQPSIQNIPSTVYRSAI